MAGEQSRIARVIEEVHRVPQPAPVPAPEPLRVPAPEPSAQRMSPSKAARLVGNTGPQPGTVSIADAPVPAADEPAPSPPADIAIDAEGIDEFGFDPEFTDTVLMSLVRPLYRNWFRVETSGLGNVPDTGSALIVANHSGTIAIDAVMTQVALLDDHPAHRFLRMLGANLVFSTPFIGEIARKAGHTLACHPDAERLLNRGELVGVWPEGFKGVGKPFRERYKLQRFGRGGFVAAAVRTGAPIIPTAIVGAEETYPMLMNLAPVARLLGLPYFPITPTFPALGPLGLIPLPSKWMIHFGEPIATDHLGPAAADDPMIVFEMTDRVREAIQQSLFELLAKRERVFG